MIEYPKIQSVFKRDEKTHKFVEGMYSLPEFEYLKDNEWYFTEKIDGMNIRVIWYPHAPIISGNETPNKLIFLGKTDNAQLPKHLVEKLQGTFTIEKFKELYPDTSMCLYGEGYGKKIQSGDKYIPDDVGFILFDVMIDGWWLKRKDVEDIANKLGIDIVPLVGIGNLDLGIDDTKNGFYSRWGNFIAEGIVAKPCVELRTRAGDRVITKMKYKDFER